MKGRKYPLKTTGQMYTRRAHEGVQYAKTDRQKTVAQLEGTCGTLAAARLSGGKRGQKKLAFESTCKPDINVIIQRLTRLMQRQRFGNKSRADMKVLLLYMMALGLDEDVKTIVQENVQYGKIPITKIPVYFQDEARSYSINRMRGFSRQINAWARE